MTADCHTPTDGKLPSKLSEPLSLTTPRTRHGCSYQQSRRRESPLKSSLYNFKTPDVIAKRNGTFTFDKRNYADSSSHKDCNNCTPQRFPDGTSVNKIASFVEDKISPGLARLRMTPGLLKEKQQQLIHKHNAIRKRSDQLQTGGGVSLWPNMKQMRLTRSEVIKLSLQTVTLCLSTTLILRKLHGDSFHKLQNATTLVYVFCSNNTVMATLHEESLQQQVLSWHMGLLELTDHIQSYFDMSVMSPNYQLYVLGYLLGLAMLVYYLLDNMLAKNKLTPSRIKKWTCLLVVIGTWTVVMAHGLILAYSLEKQIVKCVQKYSDSLASLVTVAADLSMYHNVLLYWRGRFLDPASQGLVHILNVISVRDVIFYLQYYSVPIITVLVWPIVKLCCACWTVHGQGEYVKTDSNDS